MIETILLLPVEILWAVSGLIFVFIEFVIPRLVMVFFGIGAMITAATTWLGYTPSLLLQLSVFIGSSVILLLLLRKYVKRKSLGKPPREGEEEVKTK